jgi:thioredoxin-dependent peroxiredoxin
MAESASTMPAEGDTAPVFELESDVGAKVSLKKLKGGAVIVYFYPKDDTPGCTVEAQQFRDQMMDFEKQGVTVLGISPDDVASHCKFINKYELNFALLADTEHAVAERYGAWVEKNNYGRKYWGVQRSTFLIDKAGKIAKAWPKVKADGHAAEVLEAAKALG